MKFVRARQKRNVNDSSSGLVRNSFEIFDIRNTKTGPDTGELEWEKNGGQEPAL